MNWRYAILAAALAVASCNENSQTAKQTATAPAKNVTVVTPMSHPSLQAAIEGFRAGLTERGLIDGKDVTITVENAQNDWDKIMSLVKSAIAKQTDLVFVVTTPAASRAITVTEPAKVPLVYAAVTNPVAAEIVTSMGRDNKRLSTGVSDRYPVEQQITFIQQIMPTMKRLGVLYSAGEQNSKQLADETSAQADRLGIASPHYVVPGRTEISSEVKRALAENDAVIVNGDNVLTEHLEAVLGLAARYEKPVFVGDPDSVRKGAVATVGPSYFDNGRRAGMKAAEVLSGTDIRSIPSEYPTRYDYIVNTEAAKQFNLLIPPTVWQTRAVWESRDGPERVTQ